MVKADRLGMEIARVDEIAEKEVAYLELTGGSHFGLSHHELPQTCLPMHVTPEFLAALAFDTESIHVSVAQEIGDLLGSEIEVVRLEKRNYPNYDD
jgi:hypothetical protein